MSRWPFALLPEIGTALAEPARSNRKVIEQLREPKDRLERPPWNKATGRDVSTRASDLAGDLARWENAIPQWQGDPGRLMKRISFHSPADSWTWEEATQRSLALWALERSRQEKRTAKEQQLIQKELLLLADKLAFPPGYSGPGVLNDDDLQEHFQRIRRQLGEKDPASAPSELPRLFQSGGRK